MPHDLDAILAAVRGLADRAIEAARTLTRGGEAIDEHQVVVERIAHVATQARVIAELAVAPAEVADEARVAVCELAAALPHQLGPVAPLLGLAELAYPEAARQAIADGIAPA